MRWLLLLVAWGGVVFGRPLQIASALMPMDDGDVLLPVVANLTACGFLELAAVEEAVGQAASSRGYVVESFPPHLLAHWVAVFNSSQIQTALLTDAARAVRGLGLAHGPFPFHCPPGVGACAQWECQAVLEAHRVAAHAMALRRRHKAFRRAFEHLQQELDAAEAAPGDASAEVGVGGDLVDFRGRGCVEPPAPLPNPHQCIILFWGTFYKGHVEWYKQELMEDFQCDPPLSCVFTDDDSLLPLASAVLLHDWVPTGAVPPVRYCGQKWVFHSIEAPSHAIAWGPWPASILREEVDAISSHRLDSDVPHPYFPYEGQAEARGLFDPPVAFAEKKQDVLAAWVTANCLEEYVGRTDKVLELMEFMAVDSYGTCLHNKDWPEGPNFVGWHNHMKPDMETVLNTYKFLLVFENSRCVDYVTEKLWRAFRMGVVPVYIGAPNVGDFAPTPHSVIRASDFRSMQHLAEHLRALADDESAYNHLLSYKADRVVTPTFRQLWMTARPAWQCRLCDWVQRNRTRRLWEDRSCTYEWGHY